MVVAFSYVCASVSCWIIFFIIFVSSVSLPAWRRCPSLATILSVVLGLFSLLFSERVPV